MSYDLKLRFDRRGEITRALAAAIRECISVHGPIGLVQIGSATKRCYGALKGVAKERKLEDVHKALLRVSWIYPPDGY